uniref:Uncharacterized protein n=1 Tax=Panagrolaimus sp. JU765 TaxID=591449 RepID=A0AC34Q9Q6_9BILA
MIIGFKIVFVVLLGTPFCGLFKYANSQLSVFEDILFHRWSVNNKNISAQALVFVFFFSYFLTSKIVLFLVSTFCLLIFF